MPTHRRASRAPAPAPHLALLALLALAGTVAGCTDPVTAEPPPRVAAEHVANVTLTELGFSGSAVAIATNGHVAGTAYIGGQTHAVVWDHGVLTDLGTAGEIASAAAGISLGGHVVGSRMASDGTTDAVLWADGVATVLPTLAGSYGTANGISPVGDFIVGYNALPKGFGVHAVLWHDGEITDLGTEGENSYATAVNEHGQVVGTIYDPSGFGNPYQQAVLWQDGKTTKLGTLGGPWSIASGINARGQVVGWSAIRASHDIHAFLWQNGTMTDLGTLGGPSSYAYGINERGQIVGVSQTADYVPRAALWDNGVISDFETLAGEGSFAQAISDAGVIVGSVYGASTAGLSAVSWKLR